MNGVDAWASKEITLETVASKIANGSNIYIGSTASTPEATLRALVNSWTLVDIQILQMIPGGSLPHLTGQHPDQFRTRSFYSFTKTTFYKPAVSSEDDELTGCSDSQVESLADYTPMSISAIPRLLREKILEVDVAIIKVSEPHKGFVSLGFGLEFTRDFVRHANLVIAEVTHHMPWTEGPSKLAVSEIDWWIRCDSEPLLTTEQLWPQFINLKHAYPQSVLDGIGRNCLQHIPNGATLKFGVSPLAFSVFPFLHERCDLGLHTDVYTENLFQLQIAGIINNSKKTIDTGRSVVSQAHGSLELYDFMDRNPAIEVHPSSYVNDPQVIAKIDNFIAVIGALKLDLTGQVATDSIAHKFYGGVWSDDDSVTGARLSKGGKAIVVLPSKSLQGRSNLVFALPRGTGVSITRSDVEYVVTEYGTAYLYGKSIRERCMALIGVAHPDFRLELLALAKANHYISSSQPGLSFRSKYPQEFECMFTTTKTGRTVFCRPIKAVDEDQLRSFFHKLSDHSVYLRYFRKLKSIPQRILQKTADLDYGTDMALVMFAPPDTAHQELVAIAQYIADNHTGIPEIAFQVRDDMQGEGLATFLLERLFAIAKSYGISVLKADVLADNRGMRKVFTNSGVPYTCTTDFGVVSYTFVLNGESEVKNSTT